MSETVQTKVYLPAWMKERLDADDLTNSELVRRALAREFEDRKKHELERQIEERRRELSNKQSIRNERQREIEQLQQDIEALEQQLHAVERVEHDQNEAVQAFVDANPAHGSPPADPENPAIQEQTPDGMSVAEFAEAVAKERNSRRVDQ